MCAIDDQSSLSETGLFRGFCRDQIGDRMGKAHPVRQRVTNVGAGARGINDHHQLDLASPWGGFKNSGVGRETGIESFDHFSELRAVTVNTSGIAVDWYADDGQLKRLD